MEPYKEMYYKLFNEVTDTIRVLMRMDHVAAINKLIDAQLATEEMFMDAGAIPDEA